MSQIECIERVEVVVPTKFSDKLIEVQCGGMLSLEQEVFCGKHPSVTTLRCHMCQVGGFLAQANLEDHWQVDCDRGEDY
mgnify:FL=1